MSLSPWDPSPNRNAPAPSKSLQSSSRPAFRKHTVHKALRTCATTTTYDNVRQCPTRYFLGATGWEECGLEDYGGGGCCSCRHLEAMKSHEKHSSQKRKQIQVSRFFFTQTQLISVKCWFVQILRSKPKADLMSVDCRIHSPSRIRTS